MAASAARKALFFVELLHSNRMREQAAGVFPKITASVQALRASLEAGQNRHLKGLAASFHFEDDEAHCREQIWRIVRTISADAVAGPLHEQWLWIQTLAQWPAQHPPQPEELDRLLTHFVERAIPLPARLLDNLQTLVGRNLAALTGLVGLCAVVFGVTQVRSLLFDFWWYSAWALLILVPVPLLSLLGHWARKSGQRFPLLSSWGQASLFWRASARYPSGYDVFLARGNINQQLLVAALSKAALFLLWLAGYALLFAVASNTSVLQTIVWTVCLFAAAGAGLALLDFWDFMHPAPVRLVFLIVGLGLLFLYASTDFSLSLLALEIVLALCALAYFLKRRAVGWRSLGTVVVLVTLLGASASLVDENTENGEAWIAPPIGSSAPSTVSHDAWPAPGPARQQEDPPPHPVIVMAASGGGSRAAVLTALALTKLSKTCLDGEPSVPEKGCETFGDHLHAISSVSGGSLATAAYISDRLRGAPVDDLVDVVADDFLQPVLLGALNPRVSRGQALEDYWKQKLGLNPLLGQVAQRWNETLSAAHPALPIPLFNSASLDGHAVVLTPLDWSNCAPGQHSCQPGLYARIPDPTWVFYRTCIYSLTDLLPGFDANLAQAVRASANFPFGFPVVQVATQGSLNFSPAAVDLAQGPKERVRLTDGGVLSNSGMWTLFRLLVSHVDQLRDRGVILVFVDGSKMPEYTGRTRVLDLVNAILDQSPIAGNLHETMIALLQTKLGGRFGVVDVALEPTLANNVYTSWALDTGTRQRLEDVFQPKLAKMLEELETAWNKLDRTSETIDTVPDRLPLD